jgi:hypothetical protein
MSRTILAKFEWLFCPYFVFLLKENSCIPQSVEKLAEVLGKVRMFDSIDSYDFPILYATLPHKLIKHKFSYLIKWSFRKSGCDYICCNDYISFCQ